MMNQLLDRIGLSPARLGPARLGRAGSRHWRRWPLMAVAVALITIATAPPAAADAAGPTDYRTEIISIEPATSAFSVSMVGGDAFILLEQLEPVEIVVLGYQSEDYLRFDADGTVVENRRSPATWLNEERYGTEEELPSFVDYEAPPQWRRVADNGRFAWHDHRTHWMNPEKPPGAEPGDQVLDWAVPLRIGNESFNINVASYLLDDPPLWPAALGVLFGATLGAVGLKAGRLGLTAAAVVVAVGAAVAGAVAFGSVPAETGPDRLLWALPVLALVALVIAAATRTRLATTVYLDGLGVVAGVALLAWALVVRFEALRRSLIPSEVPPNLDRLIIGAALTMGAICLLRGFSGLSRPQRINESAITTATRPTRPT